MAGRLGRIICIVSVVLAMRLIAQPPAGAAAKVQRAAELIQAGKPEQAIPIYRELAAAFPGEASFGVNLALAQYKAGRYRETIEQCESLLKLQPDLFPAWLFLGGSHLSLGEASRAVDPLQKAVALQPSDRNARIMLAGALLVEKRHAEAAPQFEVAAGLMPDNPRIWYGLVQTYDALATESFQRLEQAAPHSAELLAFAGYFEFERGQLARAFERFRRALAIQPSFRGLHASIAAVYGKTGHSDWALAERAKESQTSADCHGQSLECEFAAGRLCEITSVSEDTPEALYWRSRALLELTLQAYAHLAELPASPEKYQSMASRYEKAERYADAATAWKEALALSPQDTGIQQRLALALCHSNDCASALPLLGKLLAREPSSAELNFLYGKALSSVQDAGQALRYLEIAVKLDSKFLPAHGALGQAYLEVGSLERAIPELEAALGSDEDGSRHYQLARAYQALGKQEQASVALRDYREILRRRNMEDQDQPRITPPEP